eukprot:GILK01004649.1.p1 GENE.GILK01004649.1~~GILK01004649.1.p1  ORF type:complete len:311 (+),score=38.88 GILK01004649.1:32-934(+)
MEQSQSLQPLRANDHSSSSPKASDPLKKGTPKIWRALVTFYWCLCSVVIVVVTFCLQLLVFPIEILVDNRRLITGRLFRLSGAVAAHINPLWRFSVLGAIPETPRKCVVIANHSSFTDVMLLGFLPWDMKYMSKRVNMLVPFFGWSMWLAGDIPVVRNNRSSASQALDLCSKWLQRNVPVLIFPEGTRSRTGELLPFKDGAFKLAIQNGADILPIGLYGTADATPKDSFLFGKSYASLKVGNLISVAGLTTADVPSLRETCRDELVKLLDELKHAKQSSSTVAEMATLAAGGYHQGVQAV